MLKKHTHKANKLTIKMVAAHHQTPALFANRESCAEILRLRALREAAREHLENSYRIPPNSSEETRQLFIKVSRVCAGVPMNFLTRQLRYQPGEKEPCAMHTSWEWLIREEGVNVKILIVPEGSEERKLGLEVLLKWKDG